MKKFLVLLLCLLVSFSMFSAVAETALGTATDVEPIEMLFDGVWVKFEDGFEFYLPSNWVEYELTQEDYAGGIFYAAGSEDGTYSALIGWSALEAEMTIEELQAALAGVYPDADVVEVNGVALLAFTDTETNLITCIAMDGTEPGYYMFAFSPADDENFQNLAALIASSIRNCEV